MQVNVVGMDPARLKREFGRDLVFFGGIDTQKIPPFGTTDGVRDHVKRTVMILNKDGGYIFAPAHDIERGVPVENVLEMYETVAEAFKKPEEYDMIHFKPPRWVVGDVHPYFENGQLYLYYLKPKGITLCDACFEDPEMDVCEGSRLAVTKDYLYWTDYPLSRTVVNIVKVGGTYYCCQDTGEHSFIASDDLYDWRDDDKYHFELDTVQFPATARDYALFWDKQEGGLRTTVNAYYTNADRGIGEGLECCVALSGVIRPGERTLPTPQRMLYRMFNTGKPLNKCLEAECNQLIDIGGRWYLVASLARQSEHWVGAPSYWMGDENMPLGNQDYTHRRAYQLDGEDLCAAQVARSGDKYYLFGWIPINARGQEWGGHLNLPREVYALPDGRLATRLDADFAKRIRGDTRAYCIPARTIGLLSVAPLTERYNGYGVCTQIDPRRADKAGILVNRAGRLCAYVDVAAKRLRIAEMRWGETVYIYAEIELFDEDLCAPAELHAIYDGDIVEVFYADRYGLCARVPYACNDALTGAFASAPFDKAELIVYTLAGEAMCEDMCSTHAPILSPPICSRSSSHPDTVT